MNRKLRPWFVLAILVLAAGPLAMRADETQRVYLSGRGKDDAVPWKFMCTTGALSGFWTNIPVPSNWDVLGFGHLTYKKDYSNAVTECGLYEKDFVAAPAWKEKRVFLVFEGAMTDTSTRLNGKSVGPIHQGGFYRFKYDVTDKLKLGETNLLEVTVAKHSANESVNKAERLADYWVFGGIYRPVYLEVVPQQFIERVAIDARADGRFTIQVFARGLSDVTSVEMEIIDPEGNAVPGSKQSIVDLLLPPSKNPDGSPGGVRLDFGVKVTNPKLWTAETPNLYTAEVRLKRGSETIHRYKQRFGFRTFEVRDGDGLYLNGQKIILKGVNRHSFWPDSGRCLSEAVHRLDIETIKAMNGNAVRMSHYPPDAEFLDLCDELGLYVLDELAGWHNHYDSEVGRKLVEAMVTRDVNHPSILFWDNGNEGGFNTNLDHVFLEFDPQKRRVLHPWAPFNGINTAHYLAYTNAEIAARGEPMYYQPKPNDEVLNTNLPNGWIYMPTEFMHGLYDGGGGAGLEDYWTMMMTHSNCAGGFIWAFADEGIRNPSTGEIDTAGNQSPDGMVGPYREREASFYAIQDIWAPIQVKREASGTFTMQNDYSFTDTRDLKFEWRLNGYTRPPAGGTHMRGNNATFTVQRGYSRTEPDDTKFGWRPSLASSNSAATMRLVTGLVSNIPARSGPVAVGNPLGDWEKFPMNWDEATVAALQISDKSGRTVAEFTWPEANEIQPRGSFGGIIASYEINGIHFFVISNELLRVTNHMFGIDLTSGQLRIGGNHLQTHVSLNGPRLPSAASELLKFDYETNKNEHVLTFHYAGDLKSVVWRVKQNGWLQCDFKYTAAGTQDVFGVVFDYPENLVKKKRWLGDGPYRVWKNRLRGVTFGEWENEYNNTITGYREWKYPEFKGCFSNVRWLQLETTEGLIAVVPENIPYVQVLTPEQPPDNLVGKTKVNLPQCGLGFLHGIPPIGTKFKPAAQGGPQGQSNMGQGEYLGRVSFYFGKLP